MIHATYHILAPAGEASRIAREIALEQTVEVPESLVTDERIRREVVGQVEAVEPLPGEAGRFAVRIAYNGDLASGQLPQLLNLLYGNISIKPGIRLVDFDLPGALLARFGGPRYGIEGLRALTGVYGRPLLATALKPRGSSAAALAALAGAFALGGGDIIKDDHNLVDADFDAWRERVSRCHEAVEAANVRTGRRALYLPNLLLRAGDFDRHLEFLVNQGVAGALVSPMLIGFDTTRWIAERYPLALMAHPAFSGVYYTDRQHGIAPGLALGRLMRLAGCDASVYPNAGGRFALTREECGGIAASLREPLGGLKPAWPAPAGGMNYEKLPAMAEQYGPDTIFLIGGALLSHSPDLAASARLFLDSVRRHFSERLEPPAAPRVSSCERPARADAPEEKPELLELLKFRRYTWQGRRAAAYKQSAELPFEGVTRQELIGPAGEAAAFDLRYFEIEPGGFTSLERHNHTHTVIVARGEGTLLLGGRRRTLRRLDIAYIGPMEPHQLRNETSKPFGFFCIVDRERDRPRPVE